MTDSWENFHKFSQSHYREKQQQRMMIIGIVVVVNDGDIDISACRSFREFVIWICMTDSWENFHKFSQSNYRVKTTTKVRDHLNRCCCNDGDIGIGACRSFCEFMILDLYNGQFGKISTNSANHIIA